MEEEIKNTPEEPAEELVEAPAEEAAGDEAEDVLKIAEALAEDYKRKWYSVTAEYENYRRRMQHQAAQRYAEGRADVVSRLFPIADNLERALAACQDEGTKHGIELVVKAFLKVLDDERITVIDPLGAPFDPEKCEAIMAVEPEEGEESGTVKQVYLKGYEQDGKVLRFAQVVVIK